MMKLKKILLYYIIILALIVHPLILLAQDLQRRKYISRAWKCNNEFSLAVKKTLENKNILSFSKAEREKIEIYTPNWIDLSGLPSYRKGQIKLYFVYESSDNESKIGEEPIFGFYTIYYEVRWKPDAEKRWTNNYDPDGLIEEAADMLIRGIIKDIEKDRK